MNTLFLPADTGACSHYRCHNAALALRLAGYHADVAFCPIMKDTKEYDVVVMQRQYHTEIGWNIDIWHKAGITVFYEIDDLLTAIPDVNPASREYAGRQDIIENMLRSVDGLIVSTEALADVLGRYNRNILVVENYMDLDFWGRFERKRGHLSGRPLVGWMGGPSHVGDLGELRGIFDALDADVVFSGYQPDWTKLEWKFRDMTLFADTPVLFNDFDIGLAPLAKGRFNECKSAIKFMEYALYDIPTVASDIGPYHRTIKQGETGYLARYGKDWIKTLKRLLANPDLRDEVGARAHQWVIENRSVQNRYEEIADGYLDFFEACRMKTPTLVPSW